MNITEILLLSLIFSVMESFENKKFHFKLFVRTYILFFIFAISVSQLLDKFLPKETLEKYNYGILFFSGMLLLITLYLSIKTFLKNKQQD
jgi:hypothetical protein